MSTTSNRVKFPAHLRHVINPETGEEFLLRSDAEIEEDARLARADFEQQLAVRRDGGEKEDAQERARSFFEANLKAGVEREKQERDAAADGGANVTAFGFTLVKPTYGQLEQIREQATDYDYSSPGGAAPQWNERRYRRLLLENEGLLLDDKPVTPSGLEGLPTVVVDELAYRLARSIQPDKRRLLFTSPPSGQP